MNLLHEIPGDLVQNKFWTIENLELDRELSGLKEFTTCRVVGERRRNLNCVVRFLDEKRV